MEQILECLLAQMEANQGRTDATLKELKTSQEHLKEEMRFRQELLKEEMLAKLDAHHERTMAWIDSQLKENGSLSRKDIDHGFEGRSSRNGVQGRE
jgi:hypothetical protein